MAHQVETRREQARGCGYRKEGGLYLVCDGEGKNCERMPIPLTSCPTCSQGIKPARGWSWIESGPILEANPCRKVVRMEPVVEAELGDLTTADCDALLSGNVPATCAGASVYYNHRSRTTGSDSRTNT
jgi:hypothetical protein